jgi:hypothetical protein
MARVLMVSPHFPPDASAGAHRVRLLAPHLEAHGWQPTVLAVDPRDDLGRLDHELGDLVPPGLRLVRCRAWSSRWTRRLGVGDLGLRAFLGLYRACRALLRNEKFDALFVTVYPTYPALLGPIFKRRLGIPFVLDYQDPWVGAWGATVGPGRGGRPDLKSRVARALATRLEPRAARAADGITAVSTAIYEDVRRRHPGLGRTPCTAIPLGGEPADFDHVQRQPRPNRYFDPKDGRAHLCYVGTVLPMGLETLRAVLKAVARLRDRQPALFARLRLHFLGTSNQTTPDAPRRVLDIARELGVVHCDVEIAPRIPYLDALTVLVQATGILLMGSSERHYTASKLYPALLAERPILAVYHAESSVVEILRRAARPPSARLVTYDDATRAEGRVESIRAELERLLEAPSYDPEAVDTRVVTQFSARCLAGTLAAVLDQATGRA